MTEKNKKKIALLISGLIDKMKDEIYSIKHLARSIESRALSPSDIESFNLIKLRYNKLIL